MPLGKSVRSSSASGRLETKHVTSILSELGGAGQRIRNKRGPGGRAVKTEALSVPRPSGVEDRGEQPDWLVREQLKHKRRRSVTQGEKVQLDFQVHSSSTLKIDEKLSLDNLQKMKFAFEKFEKNDTRGVDVEDFGRILKRCLDLSNTINAQIDGLFEKIDYSDQGRISWGEFSTYVLQQCKEKEETVRRSKQVAFSLPATINNYGQGIPVVNIHSTDDDTLVTVREDGFICLWHPELKPKQSKHMFGEDPAIRRSKWVSCFTLMSEYNKLIIGTGDREIQIYDLFDLEPYCQINSLDTIPLTLNYSYTGHDKCCLLYGDAEGCVNIMLMSSVEDTLR